ncbi:MAG: hypothetical protein ACRDNK_09645 [Solirubrobacteraceae bacterium]
MSDRSSSHQRRPERSPWSRLSVLISGAFLLALVLLSVIVAVTGGGSSDAGRPTSPQPAVSSPAPPSKAQAGASGCTLPAGPQTVPADNPPQAQWGTVGSMQVPQNPAVFGPQRSNGPWETCFAHNPSGALLAAMNLWAEGTAVPPGELFERLAVGAPKNLGSSAQLDSNGPVQFAGYRYDSYTPSEAQVAIVFRGPEGKLLAVVTSMVWSGGDWKYLFPAGGAPAMQVIADLTGYVQWSSF